MVTLLASSLKLNRRFPGPSESQKSGQTRLSPSCPTCLGLAVTQRLTASPEIRPFVTSWIIHEPPNIFRQGNPGPPKARKYYKSWSVFSLNNRKQVRCKLTQCHCSPKKKYHHCSCPRNCKAEWNRPLLSMMLIRQGSSECSYRPQSACSLANEIDLNLSWKYWTLRSCLTKCTKIQTVEIPTKMSET